MSHEGDKPATEQSGEQKPVNGTDEQDAKSLFLSCSQQFFIKKREIMKMRQQTFDPTTEELYTPQEKEAMNAARRELGAGGAIGCLSVYLGRWYQQRRRGLPGVPRGTGLQAALGLIAGAALFRFARVGRLFESKEHAEWPWNLDRDCPAYLLLDRCARRQDCVEVAEKIGDRYRMLEGYRACMDRALENRSSEFPPAAKAGSSEK